MHENLAIHGGKMFKNKSKKDGIANQINDWKKRCEQYRNFTKDDFANLDDQFLIDACVAWTEKFKYSDRTYKNASLPCQNMIAVLTLDSQVKNGGFGSFYSNGYGDYGIDFVNAFRCVGLLNLANLISEIDKLFRINRLTENSMYEYDERYFELEEESDSFFVKYIRNNINSFGD